MLPRSPISTLFPYTTLFRSVYDVDTRTPADVDAFPAGYICPEDDVVVGLQTDVPLKRAMMPNGGWRMVETAIKEAGKEIDEDRSEEHTSELQSRDHLECRLLLENNKQDKRM